MRSHGASIFEEIGRILPGGTLWSLVWQWSLGISGFPLLSSYRTFCAALLCMYLLCGMGTLKIFGHMLNVFVQYFSNIFIHDL